MPYSWTTFSGSAGTGGYYKPHGFYGCPTVSDGFLRTTVQDLAQHLLTFMNDGTHPVSGVRLLSPESVQMMRKQHYPHASSQYGLFCKLHRETSPVTLTLESRLICAASVAAGETETGANAASSNDPATDVRFGHGGGDPGVSTTMKCEPFCQ
jgi:CubicO group peptidase (beta-lactamase class C family)